MNWDAIGAMGEVGGAVAVVATLAYLARQVSHGTSAVLAANHEAMISALRSTRHLLAQDSSLADLVLRGEAGPTDLSEVDHRRFEEFVASQFEIWEQAFIDRDTGTIDQIVWDGWDGFGREKFVTDGHWHIWRKTRLEFYVPFRDYLDREVFGERRSEQDPKDARS